MTTLVENSVHGMGLPNGSGSTRCLTSFCYSQQGFRGRYLSACVLILRSDQRETVRKSRNRSRVTENVIKETMRHEVLYRMMYDQVTPPLAVSLKSIGYDVRSIWGCIFGKAE